MFEGCIFSTLPLPGVATIPSNKCIQWSEDGQALLLTRQAIVILTPEFGIDVEPSSILRPSLDGERPIQHERCIGWYRTMLERGKFGDPHQWAFDCQDWSGVSLGLMDLAFIDVACSPGNTSSDAGCVLAVLDSNFEVALYKPEKNGLTGQWKKVADLLDILVEVTKEIENDPSNSDLLLTLHKQVSSVSWSLTPDFGFPHALSTNGSILAVGTCAGTVQLLRYNDDRAVPLEVVQTIEISDKRVTHLSWSPWIISGPNQVQSLLACGIADGSIEVFKVSQSLERSDESSILLADYKINISQELFDTACEPTRRTTGTLHWVASPSSKPVLVFSKPGTIHFWKPDDGDTDSWHGLWTVIPKSQNQSVGSTALAPITGIAHLSHLDAIVVSLSDGSFHVIQNISSGPNLASGEGPSSEALSTTSRKLFARIEGEEIRKFDVNCTHGMVTVDHDSIFLWIQEAVRPTDLMYKYDAQHTCTIVMAKLFDSDSESRLLTGLANVVQTPPYCSETSLSIFRPLFVYLSDSRTIESLLKSLLEIIRSPSPTEDPANVDLTPYDGKLTPDLRRQFRGSLKLHIFNRSNLVSRRLRICLSNFCEKHCETQDSRNALHAAASDIAQALRSITLKILMSHIIAVFSALTPGDATFARHVAIHASRSGHSEAQELLRKLDELTSTPPTPELADALQEPCPACHAPIPFTDYDHAVCSNGHHWPRCSITSYILSTPMVRTCTSCARKSFLPPRTPSGTPGPNSASPWLPLAARTWIVEELLRTVRRCLYCGNNFVTLV